MSNEELLAAYSKSDPCAFEEYYRRTSQMLYNFLICRLSNKSDADDALQETYFRIHRYILKYREGENALSWTFTIARNVSIDIANKRKRKELSSDEQIDQPSQDPGTDAVLEAREALTTLLNQLSEKERNLLVARFIENASFEELASSHQTSQANARKMVSRMLKKLRKTVG